MNERVKQTLISWEYIGPWITRSLLAGIAVILSIVVDIGRDLKKEVSIINTNQQQILTTQAVTQQTLLIHAEQIQKLHSKDDQYDKDRRDFYEKYGHILNPR
jgi:hypothetical protein